MAAFLPYGRQLIEDDDIAAVAEALRSDFLTTGPRVERFEQAFADRVGACHAVACNSGTAALHLPTMALGLGPGDVMVVPSLTFLATANAARFTGAEVAFADVDPETGLATGETIAAAMQRGRAMGTLKALSVVHLSGRTVQLAPIARLAADAGGLPLIEDACHALGTRYQSGDGMIEVGACRESTMAAFSFHPVKTIAAGEGGMVTTNDDRLAQRMRMARSHGTVRDGDAMLDRAEAFDADGTQRGWYYEMHEVGFNYRMPDVLCALGLSQLAKLDRFVARRRELARRYDAALQRLAPVIRTVPPVEGCDPTLHLYAVLIDFTALGMTRQQVMAALRGRGIGTQVHYVPVHRQPYYRDRYGDIDLPGADAYYARELSLPLFPGMDDSDVDRVVGALGDIVERG